MSFPNILTAWRAARRGGDQYTGPKDYRTPFSSVSGGMTNIDPSIRRSEDSALSDYLSRTGTTRNRYLGNQSAFREARLNPLREQFGRRRADLQQNIGLRGLGGSSFGEQALTGFDIDSSRAIADESAKAEMEDLQTIQGLDQATFEAQMNLQKQRYAQELEALGLSRDQIAQEMGNFENTQRRKLAQVGNYNQTLNTFHKLVTDWGDFSKIGGGGGGAG